MGKNFELILTGALASALLLTGCKRQDDWTAQQDTAICVDPQGNRVPDTNCDRVTGYYGGSYHGASNAFLWYYLGRNSRIPYYGERALGGSWTRTTGATYFHAPVTTGYSRSATISRGGFGSSARSFGGFGE